MASLAVSTAASPAEHVKSLQREHLEILRTRRRIFETLSWNQPKIITLDKEGKAVKEAITRIQSQLHVQKARIKAHNVMAKQSQQCPNIAFHEYTGKTLLAGRENMLRELRVMVAENIRIKRQTAKFHEDLAVLTKNQANLTRRENTLLREQVYMYQRFSMDTANPEVKKELGFEVYNILRISLMKDGPQALRARRNALNDNRIVRTQDETFALGLFNFCLAKEEHRMKYLEQVVKLLELPELDLYSDLIDRQVCSLVGMGNPRGQIEVSAAHELRDRINLLATRRRIQLASIEMGWMVMVDMTQGTNHREELLNRRNALNIEADAMKARICTGNYAPGKNLAF